MAKRTFVSKKKLSGVQAEYRKWGEWEVGDSIIGKFVGSKIDGYKKPNWLIEVEEANFTGKKGKKEVARITGKVIGLNSTGKLDRAMKEVEIGDIVQVEYKGMASISKGQYKGKDAHDMDVDIVEAEGEESEEEESDEEEETEEDDL